MFQPAQSQKRRRLSHLFDFSDSAQSTGVRFIFLDIDGVLCELVRSSHSLGECLALQDTIAQQHGPQYYAISARDLGVVYWDWKKEAITHLKKLCEETGAKIVISSDWRKNNSIDRLKLLFGLHGLAEHVVGVTPTLYAKLRGLEIESYLKEHPADVFTILDDRRYDLFSHFPEDQVVHCENYLDVAAYQKALKALMKPCVPPEFLGFDSMCRNSPRIRTLNLKSQDFGVICRYKQYSYEEFWQIFCDGIRRNTHLQVLELERFFFFELRDKKYLAQFAAAFADNKSIVQLSLALNFLKNIDPLIDALQKRQMLLTNLDLSNNELEPHSISLLTKWVKKIQHKIEIDMSSPEALDIILVLAMRDNPNISLLGRAEQVKVFEGQLAKLQKDPLTRQLR